MKEITRQQFEDIWFDPNRTIVEKEYTDVNNCVYRKFLIEDGEVIAELEIVGNHENCTTCYLGKEDI